MKAERLLFSYGAGLDQSQMRERCPDNQFIGIGYLKDYKIIFDGYFPKRKGPVANIVPSKSDVVWGAVYKISDSDLDLLDKSKDYPITYQRKTLHITLEDNTSVEAICYLRDQQELGMPTKEYLDFVVQGARACRLPESYIEKYLLQA